MIRDLTVTLSTNGLPVTAVIEFLYVLNFGSIKVTVDLANKDKDGKPKANFTEQRIFGELIDNRDFYDDHVFSSALKLLTKEAMKVCENNGWTPYSY